VSRRSDLVAGAVLALAGGFAFLWASRLPDAPGFAAGPGTFPAFAGASLCVLGLVLCVQAWLRPLHRVASAGPGDAGASSPYWVWREALIVGLLVAAGLLLPYLGFLVTSTAFLAISLLICGSGWIGIALTPVISLLIYFCFTSLLHVSLPEFSLKVF